MNTEEWEAALIVEIISLKEAYSNGVNLLYEVKHKMNPTDEQLRCMDTLLITLRIKIERLESELLMHKILKGET